MSLTPQSRVGRWTLITYQPGNASRTHKGADRRRPMWLCRCDCGTEALVDAGNLSKAKTTGCRSCAKLGRKPHYTPGLHKEAGLSLQATMLAWGRAK